MSDSKATTAEPVAWRLIAPDGREFNGTSPINCAKKALDATVTKTQQAENFWSAFEETAREIKPSPLLTRTWSA